MQRIVSSSRRAHSHAVHAFPSRSVAESIDLELVKLQGQLPKITAERIAMQEEVALAREAERRTREEMRRAQEKAQRYAKLVCTLQAATRRFLSGKRCVDVIVGVREEARAALARRNEDALHRAEAAEGVSRIQAWWRGILGRRLGRFLLAVRSLRGIRDQMVRAAVKLQAWFRGRTQYMLLQPVISRKLEERLAQQRLQEHEKCAVIMQKHVRGVLARRWFAQQTIIQLASCGADTCSNAESERVIVDTWRPSPGEPLGTVVEYPPRRDPELEKLEAAELVPFYWASASQVVRHRIGGPSALSMRDALFREDGEGDSDEAGLHWDFYPSGITPGFLENLEDDAWPQGRKPRRLHGRNKKAGSSRRSPRGKPTPLSPPGHTERRARLRTDNPVPASPPAPLVRVPPPEPHPLLSNASVLLPKISGKNSLRARSEDSSWDAATTFFSTPRIAKLHPTHGLRRR